MEITIQFLASIALGHVDDGNHNSPIFPDGGCQITSDTIKIPTSNELKKDDATVKRDYLLGRCLRCTIWQD